MRRILQISALLLMLAPILAPASAIEMPVAAPIAGAGGSAVFDPSILIGTPLSTNDGVTVGMVTKVVVLSVGHFLIVAELNEGFVDGERTVQLSSRAASFTKDGVRLATTADSFRKSLLSQGKNPLSQGKNPSRSQ